ncbi:unnamed protein product, partial [Cyprideis torosa]
MARHRPKRRKPMAQINVVPYIDVMLVLLVIFMVTAPMLQEGVEVSLPQVEAKPLEATEDEDKIVVAVTADGQFYLDVDGQDAMPLDAFTLSQRVMEMLVDRDNKQAYVRGDESVNYGSVMNVMAALKSAGVGSASPPPAPQVDPDIEKRQLEAQQKEAEQARLAEQEALLKEQQAKEAEQRVLEEETRREESRQAAELQRQQEAEAQKERAAELQKAAE